MRWPWQRPPLEDLDEDDETRDRLLEVVQRLETAVDRFEQSIPDLTTDDAEEHAGDR